MAKSCCLEEYGRNISKFSARSEESDLVLFKKAKNGDISSRNKLVTNHLHLVLDIAHRYKDYGVDFDDLVSVGNYWLVVASDKYDGRNGNSFATHAYWWIRHGMTDLIKRQSKINKKEHLESFKSTASTDMSFIGDDEDSYYYHDYCGNDPFDKIVSGSVAFADVPSGIMEPTDEEQQYRDVLLCLNRLSDRESDIIKHYYGIGDKEAMNVAQLAKKYNMSSVRVSKLLSQGIRKIRSEMLVESLR
jgi:RNA polymerase primary sigma factor